MDGKSEARCRPRHARAHPASRRCARRDHGPGERAGAAVPKGWTRSPGGSDAFRGGRWGGACVVERRRAWTWGVIGGAPNERSGAGGRKELGHVRFGEAERDVLQLEVVLGRVPEELLHAVSRRCRGACLAGSGSPCARHPCRPSRRWAPRVRRAQSQRGCHAGIRFASPCGARWLRVGAHPWPLRLAAEGAEATSLCAAISGGYASR
jgi:hypothetical protein